jgi:hypothetical protein
MNVRVLNRLELSKSWRHVKWGIRRWLKHLLLSAAPSELHTAREIARVRFAAHAILVSRVPTALGFLCFRRPGNSFQFWHFFPTRTGPRRISCESLRRESLQTGTAVIIRIQPPGGGNRGRGRVLQETSRPCPGGAIRNRARADPLLTPPRSASLR